MKSKIPVSQEIQAFNEAQSDEEQEICKILSNVISQHLPEAESRIWHAHPVWFLEGNPVVGYSKLKGCMRLFFWSGASFDEDQLHPGAGKCKDAAIRDTSADHVNLEVERWCVQSPSDDT